MRPLIALFVFVFSAFAAHAAPQPAGYVIAFSLQGEDLAKGTAVIRGGKELAPQIYMPLFDGDTVFVRDAASVVTVDMAGAGRREVGGALLRLDVAGAMPASDDAWAIIASIGELVSGSGGEEAPTNLIAKGLGISVPWSAPGGAANHIAAGGAPLPILWSGGEGPFKLALETGDGRHEIAQTGARRFVLDTPPSGDFALVISDSAGSVVRLKFKSRTVPAAPEALLAAAPSPETANILASAWLAKEETGVWRQQAIRQLAAAKGDEAARKLMEAIAAGWR
jgi:hypothetical protein